MTKSQYIYSTFEQVSALQTMLQILYRLTHIYRCMVFHHTYRSTQLCDIVLFCHFICAYLVTALSCIPGVEMFGNFCSASSRMPFILMNSISPRLAVNPDARMLIPRVLCMRLCVSFCLSALCTLID